MKGTNRFFSLSPEEETRSDSPGPAGGWRSREAQLGGQAALVTGEGHGPARVRTGCQRGGPGH